MIKIGIVGAGHLGKIHIKLLKELEKSNKLKLVGFFDIDSCVAQSVQAQFEVNAFESFDKLLDEVDAVDIVCPTTVHHEYALKCIMHNKHIFLEKPACATALEVEELIKLNQNKQLKIQVGHVERFNPAYLAIASKSINAKYYKVSRLSPYNVRGTDVSVVLDLMIHDLDILLKLSDHKIDNIHASGFCSLSETIDHADVTLYFSDGSVANLTASRVAKRKERCLNIYESFANSYSLDFLNKKTSYFKLKDKYIDKNTIFDASDPEVLEGYFEEKSLPVPNVNAIELELEMFCDSILEDLPVSVSLSEALRVIKAAEWIENEINMQNKFVVHN